MAWLERTGFRDLRTSELYKFIKKFRDSLLTYTLLIQVQMNKQHQALVKLLEFQVIDHGINSVPYVSASIVLN